MLTLLSLSVVDMRLLYPTIVVATFYDSCFHKTLFIFKRGQVKLDFQLSQSVQRLFKISVAQ